jgi:heme/copper-type cytochrome/quinol oxidase subunit 2
MKLKSVFGLILFLGLSFFALEHANASGSVQELQIAAVEINGTKFWFPSTIIAKKGDTVKLHAISKIGGKNNIHGFAIDAFKVQALVGDKLTDIEFVADKAGIFPIRCHLHPAHIGGQLLVTE